MREEQIMASVGIVLLAVAAGLIAHGTKASEPARPDGPGGGDAVCRRSTAEPTPAAAACGATRRLLAASAESDRGRAKPDPVALRETGAITGFVRDTFHSRVPGAEVRARWRGGSRRVRADCLGRFRIPRLYGDRDGKVRLQVTATGHRRLDSPRYRAWCSEEVELVLERIAVTTTASRR